jgi:hypothetical protein
MVTVLSAEEKGHSPAFPHALLVRLISSFPEGRAANQTLYCSPDDLSSAGLRMRPSHPLALQSTLELWIACHNYPGVFLLTASVESCQTGSDGMLSANLRIHTDITDDIDPWQHLIADVMRSRSNPLG